MSADSQPSSSTRVALFTDTLGDTNGVSRFIRTIADHADARRDLHILTSTRFNCPRRPNIHNLSPLFACAMPGYPDLDLAIPRTALLLARAAALRPAAIHISTPGPIGLRGRRFALRHGLPLLATYHTDFPAYIDHLFNDAALTWAARRFMRWFYAPFDRIFVRSDDYAARLATLGIHPDRILPLIPGIDTKTFHTRHRDPTGAIWRSIPDVRPTSIKALYVGRVSVEKNLPMLARIWPQIHTRAAARGLDTQLLIVGSGPYRATMQRDLAAHDAHFLGFRHGPELSAIYASSDFFLFPSATDTLGQVVMESQSSGLPVLVTDQGGPREVVDDGRTGFVLPAPPAPGAEDRWIAAALDLLTNASLRARMSAAAHAKIQPLTIAKSFEHFWLAHEQTIADSARAAR